MAPKVAREISAAAVRWSAPYVSAPQLIATGLVSASSLDRDRRSGKLVPIGRRGQTGPRIYRVEDVERYLAGLTGDNAPPPAPRTLPVRRTSAGTEDALSRIEATARGGSR